MLILLTRHFYDTARLVLRGYSYRLYVWPDFVPTHERHADGALHRSAGRLGREVSNIVLSRNSLYSSMSILDDLFDGEVFQFHVSVLGRNPAFLGVTAFCLASASVLARMK